MSRSPILAGGLKVLIPVVLVVLLFSAGLLVGDRFLGAGKTPVADLTLGSTSPASGVSETETRQPDLPAGARRNDRNAQTPTGVEGGESKVPPAATASGPSDANSAAKPPSGPASGTAPKPGFLDTGFGAGAAPSAAGGLTRIGTPVIEGDTLEAEYAGSEAAGLDLAFLTIVRTQSPQAAKREAQQLRHSFPDNALEYEWAGRRIAQSMSNESRPDQFPPLVSMTWTSGSYAIRVVTAPLAPDRVVAARQASLTFIGALPY